MANLNVPWIAGEQTDPGRSPKKQMNEDAVGHRTPMDDETLQQRGAIYIVADGIGGHAHGEVASMMAVERIIEGYYAAPAQLGPRESLVEAINQANQVVFEKSQQDPNLAGMGTTITAAVVFADGRLILANIGDTRAYLIRDGQPRQISVDHTWLAEQLAANILSPEEAKTHPRRHQITRSLGRRPEVEVEVSEHCLLPGDTLLTCSDGLSDVAADIEIAQGALQGSPQEAAQGLIDLANSRGGPDNITVQIVRFQPAPQPAHTALAPRKRAFPWLWVAVPAALLIVVAAALFLARPQATQPTGTETGTEATQPGPLNIFVSPFQPKATLKVTAGEYTPESEAAATPEEQAQGKAPTATLAANAAPTKPQPTAPLATAPATATAAPTEGAVKSFDVALEGPDWEAFQECSLEFYKGGEKVKTLSLGDYPNAPIPVEVDADWMRFVGDSAGSFWKKWTAKSPLDVNRIVLNGGDVTIVFGKAQTGGGGKGGATPPGGKEVK